MANGRKKGRGANTGPCNPRRPCHSRAVRHPVLVRLAVGGRQAGDGALVQRVADAFVNDDGTAVLPHQVAVAMINVSGRAGHEVQPARDVAAVECCLPIVG